MAAPMVLTKENLQAKRKSAYNVVTFDDISEIDYETFFHEHLVPNKPCIFDQSVTERWKSRRDWVTEQGSPNFRFLRQQFGKATVPVANCKQEEYSSHPKQDLSLEEYLDYWKDYRASKYPPDKPCLYLKDWHFTKAFPHYDAYQTPVYFQSDWLNEFWDTRPLDDYRFVYMGPKGTWTPFHSDVYRSFSWSANICGKKKWIFYPPGCEENMKDKFGNLIYDVTSPEFEDRQKYPHMAKVKGRQLEVIQGQGQIIFVPSGWHHQVYNLEDTISINHNWLNGCNIDICWRHLQDNLNKVKQEIEDLKDMEGWNEQCQLILNASDGINYKTFVQMLKVITINRLKSLDIQLTPDSTVKELTDIKSELNEVSYGSPDAVKSFDGGLSPDSKIANDNSETKHEAADPDPKVKRDVDDMVYESMDSKPSTDRNSKPIDKWKGSDASKSVDVLLDEISDEIRDSELTSDPPCDSGFITKDSDGDAKGLGRFKHMSSDNICLKISRPFAEMDTRSRNIHLDDSCQGGGTLDMKITEVVEKQCDFGIGAKDIVCDVLEHSDDSGKDGNLVRNSTVGPWTETDFIMYDLHRIQETLEDIMNDSDYAVLNLEKDNSAEYMFELIQNKLSKIS